MRTLHRNIGWRGIVMLALAFSIFAGFLVNPTKAEAATAGGTVVCHDEMVSIVAPVAGQSKTHLKFYFWNGADWQLWTKGTFAGPIISGSVMVNEASGYYWVPKDRFIHVKIYGYYPGSGWKSFPVGHGYQFGPRTASYCQA